MRSLPAVMFLLVAAMAAAQSSSPPSSAHPSAPRHRPAPPTRPATCICRDLRDLVSAQQEEVTDLNREIAGVQARITMLRNDAGIVNNQQVRDALQVDAELWESMLGLVRRRVARLQDQMERENARIKILQNQ